MNTFRVIVLIAGLALALTAAGAWAQGQGSLTGFVQTASGQPASSLVVTAFAGGQAAGRSFTGDDGRYYIGGLAPGRYSVEVARGGSVLLGQEAQVNGPTTLNFRLP